MHQDKLGILGVRRVFVIEPGLKQSNGHPIEYTTALDRYLRSIGIECHVVSNIQIDEKTKAAFQILHPIITQSSFEIKNETNPFFKNLQTLHAIAGFCNHDLIILSSCFSKELIGTVTFLRSLPTHKRPRVAFNFHQLYPPRHLFQHLSHYSDRLYQQYWLDYIQQAFKAFNLDDEQLSFWTSPSEALSQAYSVISKQCFRPLPFLFSECLYENQIDYFTLPLTFVFLGDGRREKGLLSLLETINCDFTESPSIRFVIQNIDARGYSSVEQARFNHALTIARSASNIHIFDQTLSIPDFSALIARCSAVILPYDPIEYLERASMLFAQAVINQKPIITTSGTWMANEILNRNASGLIYQYNSSSVQNNLTALSEAIRGLESNFRSYALQAKQRAKGYQQLHRPEQYIEKIVDFYLQQI